MFFFGKPNNRKVRSKRSHVLDVTVRRGTGRVRLVKGVFTLIFYAVLAGGIGYGVWWGGREAMQRLVWENPDYFLSDLRVVNPDGALTREQVLQAAGIAEGQHIFHIDLTKARMAIEQVPQIERVEIVRDLPNRIDITITERHPVAWLTANAADDPTANPKAFLIDARGVVMRNKRLLPEHYSLPIISGVEIEDLAPGQAVKAWEVAAALELVRVNTDTTRFHARNIDVSSGYSLVITDQNRRKITFALDDVERQVKDYHRLLDDLQGTPRELLAVSFFLRRNVPVNFAEKEPFDPAPTPGEEKAEPKEKPVRKPDAAPTPKVEKKSTPAPATRKAGSNENLKKPFRSQ